MKNKANAMFRYSKRNIGFCTKRTLNWSLKANMPKWYNTSSDSNRTISCWMNPLIRCQPLCQKEIFDWSFSILTHHKDFNHSSKYKRTSYSLKFSRMPSILVCCLLENNREKINKDRLRALDKKLTGIFIY